LFGEAFNKALAEISLDQKDFQMVSEKRKRVCISLIFNQRLPALFSWSAFLISLLSAGDFHSFFCYPFAYECPNKKNFTFRS
jgi:hypothetical protein